MTRMPSRDAPSEPEEPSSASQSAPPYCLDDEQYILETSRDRAKWFFLRLFIWISIGEITVGFILSVFGFQQYATRSSAANAGQRVYLSIGVAFMFIGLTSFIICLTVWRISKSRGGQERGPRFIPVQTSNVFALREAPPSYSLPSTSYLPVLQDQPPPAYEDAMHDRRHVFGVRGSRSSSVSTGVASEQRFNPAFTMLDEIPATEELVVGCVDDSATTRVRSSIIQQLRRHVSSVGSQTDEYLCSS